MERIEEREVARAVRRALMEGGPLCAKVAATDEVPVGRIQKWATGEKQPRAWELRAILPGLLRADPDAAAAFLDDVLGLRAVGLILARAPRVEGAPTDLVTEAAEAGAAVGQVQALALAAGRDGVVSVEESQEIRAAARQAERELAEVSAVAARAEAAHLDLPGVAP